MTTERERFTVTIRPTSLGDRLVITDHTPPGASTRSEAWFDMPAARARAGIHEVRVVAANLHPNRRVNVESYTGTRAEIDDLTARIHDLCENWVPRGGWHTVGWLNTPTVDGRTVTDVSMMRDRIPVFDTGPASDPHAGRAQLGSAWGFRIGAGAAVEVFTDVEVADDQVLSMDLDIQRRPVGGPVELGGELLGLHRIPRSAWAWTDGPVTADRANGVPDPRAETTPPTADRATGQVADDLGQSPSNVNRSATIAPDPGPGPETSCPRCGSSDPKLVPNIQTAIEGLRLPCPHEFHGALPAPAVFVDRLIDAMRHPIVDDGPTQFVDAGRLADGFDMRSDPPFDVDALAAALADRLPRLGVFATLTGDDVVAQQSENVIGRVVAAWGELGPGILERFRQQDVEGWTPAHDDEHTQGELARAAASYAIVTESYGSRRPTMWPWASHWWKPSPDPRRNIEKAIGLLFAEYGRLTRAAQTAPAPGETIIGPGVRATRLPAPDLSDAAVDRLIADLDTVDDPRPGLIGRIAALRQQVINEAAALEAHDQERVARRHRLDEAWTELGNAEREIAKLEVARLDRETGFSFDDAREAYRKHRP